MTLTQKDLDEIEKTLSETFITKEDFTSYKSELFDKLDKIVKNTADTKEEVETIASQSSNHNDRLEIIESRLHLSSD